MQRFSSKVALVTGASRGLGRATALRLAREGADVAVNYQSRRDAAEEVCARIRRLGRKSVAVQADVSDLDAVAQMVRQTRASLGPIELLVNNAGTAGGGILSMTDETEWRQVLGVNLTGIYNVCRAVFLSMLKRRGGAIVNVASVIAMPGLPGHTAYGAAKAGVVGFSRCLALEGAPFRVRVNVVAPGLARTGMLQDLRKSTFDEVLAQVPMKRIGEADEIAAAICFLLSDEASYITGQVLAVDGGLTYR